MKTCEMTMSDNGRSSGQEHFWKCGKPAKATIKNRPGPGTKFVCGLHARSHDKVAKRFNLELSKPLPT
jgi:hypothetical protein